MPKKLEEIRKAVQKSGVSKDRAYAIATSEYKKLKGKKSAKKTR